MHKSYVSRPVGNLILKGRKAPTLVWEVRARRATAQTLAKTYDAHRRGFELFMARRFGEARPLLSEVCRGLRGRMGSVDIASQHLLHLCAARRWCRKKPLGSRTSTSASRRHRNGTAPSPCPRSRCSALAQRSIAARGP